MPPVAAGCRRPQDSGHYWCGGVGADLANRSWQWLPPLFGTLPRRRHGCAPGHRVAGGQGGRATGSQAECEQCQGNDCAEGNDGFHAGLLPDIHRRLETVSMTTERTTFQVIVRLTSGCTNREMRKRTAQRPLHPAVIQIPGNAPPLVNRINVLCISGYVRDWPRNTSRHHTSTHTLEACVLRVR